MCALQSHRSAPARNLDCHYDPNFTVSSEKDAHRASQKASLKSIPSRICTKYEKIFENGSKSKRVIYVKRKPYDGLYDSKSISPSISGFFKDYSDFVVINEEEPRLLAGAPKNRAVSGLPPTSSPCFTKLLPSSSCTCIMPKPNRDADSYIVPTIVHVQLDNSTVDPNLEFRNKCRVPTPVIKRKRTRGTQTLYRESSAQTLPYLPGTSNDKEFLETLELFKLPKILPGEGPPGLYEVEILERARRRWAFDKAVKENFECELKLARTEAERKKKMPQHKTILEAFEWEHWLQREEKIQACQMMRFELVLSIFEKRERDMHNSSKIRIEMRCAQIAAKRDQGLKKNEIEYGRELRRLKIKHDRRPRNWRKEKISDQLGDPSSEYYAPQMRYGVNPNRRHVQLSRKAFEMRMEDLEKRAVNMKKLECPFAKLKLWSKPKEQLTEVEQNFCSDANLMKLYESLKGLREESAMTKHIPKCLKEKAQKSITEEVSIEEEFVVEEYEVETSSFTEVDEVAVQVGPSYSQNSFLEMYAQAKNQRLTIAQQLNERRCEELEGMLAEYEGTIIGWLMRFLSEEMSRLQEQRKLHFVTMLAQKERWRREAAEAGLRQKENEMRRIYEQIFDETDKANVEVCEQYLDNIFGIDTREQADYDASVSTTEIAKLIDVDLQRWLNSFKLIQNPLNYDALRCLLRDLVFPDNMIDCLVRQYHSQAVVDYIMNDVLFPRIHRLLEPYDISSSISNEMVDRLIDNDLYLFSPECSSGCDCEGKCECTTPQREAKAILRKVIRYAVPGRRWRTPNERIADENVKDLITDICGELDENTRCTFIPGNRGRRKTVETIPSHLNLLEFYKDEQDHRGRTTPLTSESSSHGGPVTIIQYRKAQKDLRLTRSLVSDEQIQTRRDEIVTSVSQLMGISQYEPPRSVPSYMNTAHLKRAKSAYDMISLADRYIHTIESTTSTSDEGNYELFDQLASAASKEATIDAATLMGDLIDEVINSFIPAMAGETASTTQMFTRPRVVIVGRDDVSDSITGPTVIRVPGWEESKVQPLEEEYEEESAGIGFETDFSIIKEGESTIQEELSEENVVQPRDYEMVMYVGELKKILFDSGDDCKCQMEIDYQNHIRKLYESGKIKIIRKLKCPEEEPTGSDEKDVNLNEMVFEYASGHDSGDKTTDFHEEIVSDGIEISVPKELEDFIDENTELAPDGITAAPENVDEQQVAPTATAEQPEVATGADAAEGASGIETDIPATTEAQEPIAEQSAAQETVIEEPAAAEAQEPVAEDSPAAEDGAAETKDPE